MHGHRQTCKNWTQIFPCWLSPINSSSSPAQSSCGGGCNQQKTPSSGDHLHDAAMYCSRTRVLSVEVPAGWTLPGWAEPWIRTASCKVSLSFLSYTGTGRGSLSNSVISPLKASAFLLIISCFFELILTMECKLTKCHVYATDWRMSSYFPFNCWIFKCLLPCPWYPRKLFFKRHFGTLSPSNLSF